jgi:membrane protein YqaA with SNARE-associated domain
MPQSKKRKQHQEFHPTANAGKTKKNKSAILVAVIFFGLLGIGMAYFIAGAGFLWLFVGGVAGGVSGYFFGHQIDKAVSKK